eukprot:SAG22_NODE_12815_length_428_cov_0.933131_2_plen_52_part_01
MIELSELLIKVRERLQHGRARTSGSTLCPLAAAALELNAPFRCLRAGDAPRH